MRGVEKNRTCVFRDFGFEFLEREGEIRRLERDAGDFSSSH